MIGMPLIYEKEKRNTNRFLKLDEQKEIQSVHFFKNLALMGATLMILYYGAGPFSL